MKTDDFCGTLPPDTEEYDSPCPGKPLVSFLKGMDYSLNSLVGKKKKKKLPLAKWVLIF